MSIVKQSLELKLFEVLAAQAPPPVRPELKALKERGDQASLLSISDSSTTASTPDIRSTAWMLLVCRVGPGDRVYGLVLCDSYMTA